jgi:hypothetical protein
MKYSTNAMLNMATDFLFSKEYGIWIRKVSSKDGRPFSVFNEKDEVLYSDLEFCTMPSSIYRNERFKKDTRLTLEQAFQLANLYLEKQRSSNKENVDAF